MSEKQNPFEGDRYKVCEAFDYYTVRRHPMYEGDPEAKEMPAWGILDEEAGGYIAFTTDEEQAEQVCKALMVLDALKRGAQITLQSVVDAIRDPGTKEDEHVMAEPAPDTTSPQKWEYRSKFCGPKEEAERFRSELVAQGLPAHIEMKHLRVAHLVGVLWRVIYFERDES